MRDWRWRCSYAWRSTASHSPTPPRRGSRRRASAPLLPPAPAGAEPAPTALKQPPSRPAAPERAAVTSPTLSPHGQGKSKFIPGSRRHDPDPVQLGGYLAEVPGATDPDTGQPLAADKLEPILSTVRSTVSGHCPRIGCHAP
ncbi:hypothetical protein GCM10010329_80500 [Streptomyces spiroverticillatus]|uniref:Uncharacterized protein n=1 Tax=Streptomyces finlayi TaxID=67296 RepID=A0A918X7I2_9ACTN|nr:hypothetical protein GCM10010329_80500 [Streptomyces spiroverticillatus]GHD15913.1 hypothetical protein GCM10010334_76420 [Streptomyces finlayi]